MLTVDLDRLGIRPGDRVLDIGCGSGRHLPAAARRQAVVFGADRCVKDLYDCRHRMALEEKLGQVNGTWTTAAADIVQLPFADRAFDLVICSEVLEHVPDHDSAAAELARVLKPKKALAVSVPRYLPERICWALSQDYRSASGGHVRIYRQAQLVSLLAGHGFTLEGRSFAHALHTPFWWLKCAAGLDETGCPPVNLYHRLLVWDMMRKPLLTRTLERLLNPVLGKSAVLYLRKDAT